MYIVKNEYLTILRKIMPFFLVLFTSLFLAQYVQAQAEFVQNKGNDKIFLEKVKKMGLL